MAVDNHKHQAIKKSDHESPDLPYLIFFLTGNPGLIGYYKQYLELLARAGHPDYPHGLSQPDASSGTGQQNFHGKPCVIAGFSLGGFEVGDDHTSNASISCSGNHTAIQDNFFSTELTEDLMFPPGYTKKDVYGLNDQIELSYARLQHLCRRMQEQYADASHIQISKKPTPLKVILVGHSVGGYLALEMVRLHHEQFLQERGPSGSSSQPFKASVDTNISEGEEMTRFQIVSTLLLTPTIIDLARSSSGRVAGPLLSNIPFLPSLLQYFSSGFGRFLSTAHLEWIVQKFTGMKPAGPGLRTTVAFLLSNGGVKQALHMAGDELRDMGSNKWGDEIWGTMCTDRDVETSSVDNTEKFERTRWRSPKLFFLFAEKDHWVADVTRDTIIEEINRRVATNATNNNEAVNDLYAPVMIIERKTGLVHAWCLEQSEIVAGISQQWIADSIKLRG